MSMVSFCCCARFVELLEEERELITRLARALAWLKTLPMSLSLSYFNSMAMSPQGKTKRSWGLALVGDAWSRRWEEVRFVPVGRGSESIMLAAVADSVVFLSACFVLRGLVSCSSRKKIWGGRGFIALFCSMWGGIIIFCLLKVRLCLLSFWHTARADLWLLESQEIWCCPLNLVTRYSAICNSSWDLLPRHEDCSSSGKVNIPMLRV